MIALVVYWAESGPTENPKALRGDLYCDNSGQNEPNSFSPPPLTHCRIYGSYSPEQDGHNAVNKETKNEQSSLAEFRIWLRKGMEDPIALFTAVLTLSTTLLWVETFRLRRGADKQQRADERARAKDARRTVMSLVIARRSANAAQTSADATIESNIRAGREWTQTHRAFVSLKALHINPAKHPGFDKVFSWRIMAEWQNNGPTTTKRGKSWINWAFVEGYPQIFHDIADSNPVATNPTVHIGPQGVAGSTPKSILTMHLVNAKRGNGNIFVWGWFEYNDVFTSSDRHRTEFCYLLGIDGNPNDSDCHITRHIYGGHNGADDECQHQPKTI